MAMFLRFDGVKDRVSIPAVPAMPGDWQIRFRGAPRLNGDVQIAGSNANFNRQIVLRTSLDFVRVRGELNTAYDVPCVINQNEYIDLLITSTISPARLTVFKNTGSTDTPVWVQQGQAAFTQGLDGFDTIGNVSTSFGQLDLYELRFTDATNDRRYLTDGITSGTVLPDVLNSANNGTLINFTGTHWVNDELFTLPATITPLTDFTSSVVAPFVDGPAVVSFSGVNVNINISGGQFTTRMPLYTDGQFYPKIPLSGAITLTQGASTSTIYRPISLPSGYQTLRTGDAIDGAAPVNFLNVIQDDDEYLGWWFNDAGNPLTATRTIYWPSGSGLFINRDSSYYLPVSSAPLTVDVGVRNDSDGVVTTHTINFNEAGDPVSVTGGLTMTGLTMSGLTMSGLTMSGM